MNHDELRRTFLDFYAQRGHTVVPSSSLVPKDDPTLLFTTAGMVQFKPFYAGTKPLPYRRAVSIQKCLRLTDLPKIGKSPKYCTFFEMLGNFSFGDYFKKEGIIWAWEYLVDVVKLAKERLYVSVFYEDEEAHSIWEKEVGLESGRIYRLGEEDNFWGPAGGVGACGPSSEIFFDLGEEFGCGKETCAPGCDCDRFIELYNVVFPQYDQQLDGKRFPLKNRGIDTGMGLERLAMVSSAKKTIFETDLFDFGIKSLERILAQEINEENRVFFYTACDHIRALVFTISDGILPSNEGRSYILRLLLRRASLLGFKTLKKREPFLYKTAGDFILNYAPYYPELKDNLEKCALIMKAEEEKFLLTLENSLGKWEEVLAKHRSTGVIPGEELFKLHDTYGLNIEIIEELAKDEEISLDKEGYEKMQEEAKKRSRKKIFVPSLGEERLEDIVQEFVGYEELTVETEIVHFEELAKNFLYEVYLSKTPFYAEKGGQIGDQGKIKGEDFELLVKETYYKYGLSVNKCELISGEIKKGKVSAVVDAEFRKEVERAHTATHLLHKALKMVLGQEIRQEGSLVLPGRLRFDFNFLRPLKKEEIEEIEEIVWRKVTETLEVKRIRSVPIEKAKEMGAIALFTEEYGEVVDVIKIGDFSLEVCGGTHLRNSGEIGLFKIISETSVAAGIRRISAVVGLTAWQLLSQERSLLLTLAERFQTDVEKLMSKIDELLEKKRFLEKKSENLSRVLIEYLSPTIKSEKVRDFELILEKFSYFTVDELRSLADQLKKKEKVVAILLTGEKDLRFVVMVTKDLLRFFSADALAIEIGRFLEGGGGGRKDLAEGGGKIKPIKDIKKFVINHLLNKIQG